MISVFCISNGDCENLTGATVCKETVAGGSKTCQASVTCNKACSSNEFCAASNICQNGKLYIGLLVYCVYMQWLVL